MPQMCQNFKKLFQKHEFKRKKRLFLRDNSKSKGPYFPVDILSNTCSKRSYNVNFLKYIFDKFGEF